MGAGLADEKAGSPLFVPSASSSSSPPSPSEQDDDEKLSLDKKNRSAVSVASVESDDFVVGHSGSSSGSSKSEKAPPLPAEPPSEDVVADDVPAGGSGDEKDEDGGDGATATTMAAPPVPPEEQIPPRYSVHSTWAKRWIVLGASLGAFISPLTGQIYLPALNEISSYFHITDAQVNLTVTTYMVFQGVTPMFLGGMADGVGRRPTYLLCFVIYIAANIGLALCRNYVSLMVVRCLQSAGSASTVALCQAVVADIVSSAERGQYIGITIIPIVFAPSLGPVLGGVLSEFLGWRAIFWFLAIVAAVMFLGLMAFLPETCRKIVGDGSIQPHPFHRTLYQLLQDRRRRRQQQQRVAAVGADARLAPPAPRPPLKMQVPNLLLSVQLALQKNIGLLLVYSSLLFAGFYAVATAMPSVLAEYGLSELEIGLCYLPTALGSVVAAFAVGPAINRNYRRHARAIGVAVDASRQQDLRAFPIERARLEVGLPLYFLTAAVMLCWGWALQRRAHLAVLCVLLFLNGMGMIGFQNAANALLIDITPGRAGAAVAANNLTRCLVGAVATAVVSPMISAMGTGWAFFLIGMVYVGTAPGIFLLMHKGMAWRRAYREKEERRVAKRKAAKKAAAEKKAAAAEGAEVAPARAARG
ncbi:major facilitator superfamily transporter multidrug resistance [Niveomyces insectorum RCEF 264]|uniref:Major facilitator superfamily transporter multidrug resistance n=1 Tax=Niveomyces insectorum RCEF 264 TaxID=1081102 RepID=A0A167S482_9HYPO|nr:major facilitator superfamily transporter multidrug resistance [Niveomyces insectorum RCEF 264]